MTLSPLNDKIGKGPFKNEAEFKSAVLKYWREKLALLTFFEIENEEKEPGMPDVLVMSKTVPAEFIEFKISDGNGVVEFQRTQPLFYRQNRRVDIYILAWDAKRDRVVDITTEEVLAAKSLRMKIPEKLDDD
jgi:hypothetical protein